MTTKLHGYAAGLLSLVGSQNFGETPKELSGVVSPIVDLTRLYLASKQEMASRSTVAAALGSNFATGIEVPMGEVWFLHGMSMFGAAAAAEQLSFYPVYMQNATQVALGQALSLGANQSGWAFMEWAPFFMAPGSRFGIFVTGMTGAPTYSGSALVSKLRI